MATIYGTSGQDVLIGTNENDTIYGYEDDDEITGGLGNDYLYGGTGSDVYKYLYTHGNDVIEDEGGSNDKLILDRAPLWSFLLENDDLYLSCAAGGSIRITDQFAAGNTNRIETIQFIYEDQLPDIDLTHPSLLVMTNPNDNITGTVNNDLILGGYGSNYLYGEDGDDIIYGCNRDHIYGGAGNDTIFAADYSELFGGSGNDTFKVYGSGIVVYAGDGNDIIDGYTQAKLYGENGDDLIIIDRFGNRNKCYPK